MLGYGPIGSAHGSLAKVVRPSNHDAVELAYLFLGIPPAPLLVGHFADSAADRLNLSLRRTLAHIRVPRPRRVAATKGVTQKVERFAWNLTNVRLLLVDRQFQLPKDAAHRVHRLLGVSATADHQVVRVVHDLGLKTPLVSQHLPSQNESPHVEVTQQR